MSNLAITRAGRALLLLLSFSFVLAIAEGALRSSARPNDAGPKLRQSSEESFWRFGVTDIRAICGEKT